MNSKRNKYIYEFAKQSDGEELANLLQKTTFNGNFELTYARNPNAYNSIKRDCEKFRVVIGRNTQNNKICGMGICSINKMLCQGKQENIAYLGGFRSVQNVVGDIPKMYKMLQLFCEENNVKYSYTTILKDNIYAQNLFTKKRKHFPFYIKIADYKVNIFKPKLKFKSKYICQQAKISDLIPLKKFIIEQSKEKLFFPAIDIEKGFYGLTYEDFYLLKNDNNEILACGILWNQQLYKQIIVKHYSLKFKIIKNLSNFFLKLLKFPIMPNIDDVVNYSTLSFVLTRNDNEEHLFDFIKQVSHFVKEEIFVYATTKKLTKKITPMSYDSNVYIVDWHKNIDEKEFESKDIYIECGLL